MRGRSFVRGVGVLLGWLLGLAPSGCGSQEVVESRDAAVPTVTPIECPTNQWFCDGLTARFCLPDGGLGESRVCRAGTVCVGDQLACAQCVPGTTSCDPDHSEIPRVCGADGRWVALPACDTAAQQQCVQGVCRNRCDTSATSYLGCEYWAVPTPNDQLDRAFSFAVVVANPQSYTVNVEIRGGRLAAPERRTVAAGAVETVVLPWIEELVRGNGTCEGPAVRCVAHSRLQPGGAYHVVADAPVAVYQFNPLEFRKDQPDGLHFSFTNDASLLLPVTVLTPRDNRVYGVLTRPTLSFNGVWPNNLRFAPFVSVVNAGSATATVTADLKTRVESPTAPSTEVAPGMHTWQVPAGGVLQLLAVTGDLSGSTIRADQPIAVFVGHDCDYVPDYGRPACDHEEEQLPPIATWGRTYTVSALRDRPSADEFSVVRVLSMYPDTRVRTTPSNTSCNTRLAAGRACEFATSSGVRILANQPVLVAQFMSGLGSRSECSVMRGVEPPAGRCVGDPAMVFETPIEQYRSTYGFLSPASYSFNYASAIAPLDVQLEMDGSPLIALGTPTLIGGDQQVLDFDLPPGAHRIRSVDGSTFSLKVYGVASYTGYMFSGGQDLRPIATPP